LASTARHCWISSQCNSTRTKERIDENVRTKNCWPLFAPLNYFIASTYVRTVLDPIHVLFKPSFFSWPDANESVWDLTRIWSSTFYDLVDSGCQSVAAVCSCFSAGVNAIKKLTPQVVRSSLVCLAVRKYFHMFRIFRFNSMKVFLWVNQFMQIIWLTCDCCLVGYTIFTFQDHASIWY
jgi:hypothetical protein